MEKSESIAELAQALAKAQGAMEPAKKSAENPYFKSHYADLAAVWDVCRGPLSDNGLSVAQGISVSSGNVVVETMLLHTSGQWLSSSLVLTPKATDPQSVGSACSYGRRYSMAALCGVSAEAEDDDGNAATGMKKSAQAEPVKRQVAHTDTPKPAVQASGTATEPPKTPNPYAGKELYIEVTESTFQANLAAMGIKTSAQMASELGVADWLTYKRTLKQKDPTANPYQCAIDELKRLRMASEAEKAGEGAIQ